MIKTIIFDFDGVIVESLKVKADAFSTIYDPYGKVIKNKVVKHHHANGGMPRYEKFKFYHKELLNITINDKEIDKLSKQFSNIVVSKVIESDFVPGVFEYINENYKKFKMFVSTATPINDIKKIIDGKKLSKYFIDIYGAPEKKPDHIKEILHKYNLKNEETLFIGDAITDMNAAKKYSMPFILRIHKYNQKQFKEYKGVTIHDFTMISYPHNYTIN